eukprot:UN01051
MYCCSSECKVEVFWLQVSTQFLFCHKTSWFVQKCLNLILIRFYY